MKRPIERRTDRTAGSQASSCDVMAPVPGLYDHLTAITWDDGTPRVTSTMSVFVQDGKWRMMLKDREAKLVCYVTADTFSDLLLVIEEAIASPETVWRVDNWAENGSTGKPRKKS